MPTYEYACTKCGHQFEAFQSFSDDALTECPECKGEVQKVYSNVGVVFKGSGFYKTDSRTSKSPSTPAASTPPPPPVTKND
ncbi:MAG: zinc ribbon domain-containing protein [Actinobacteria bacterium]|jgi:putative FmdB family regulatory protein|nr:zinc ribbon domain-containing protein [Actinomycetota bacterium]